MSDNRSLPWLSSPTDAEEAVASWMREVGLARVSVTRLTGDGGLDVISDTAVAQVKAGMSPIGRPALQGLVGASLVENKRPLFFSSAGYTAEALVWAEAADLPLFTFDRQGRVLPWNTAAQRFTPPDPRFEPAQAITGDAGCNGGSANRSWSFDSPDEVDIWKPSEQLVPGPVSGHTVASGTFFFADVASKSVMARDWDTMQPAAVTPSLLGHYPPQFYGNLGILSSHGQLAAFDRELADRYWVVEAPFAWFGMQTVVGDAILLPTRSDNGRALCTSVQAYAAASGRFRWSTVLETRVEAFPTLLAADGSVAVVATSNELGDPAGDYVNFNPRVPWFGSIHALDPAGGELLWSRQDLHVESLCVVDGKVFVVAAKPDPFGRHLLVLDGRSGAELLEPEAILEGLGLSWTPTRLLSDGKTMWLSARAYLAAYDVSTLDLEYVIGCDELDQVFDIGVVTGNQVLHGVGMGDAGQRRIVMNGATGELIDEGPYDRADGRLSGGPEAVHQGSLIWRWNGAVFRTRPGAG